MQHSFDGGDDEVMALAQGASSVGLHVTATETCVSAKSSTSTTAHTAIYDAFIVTHSNEDQ